MAVSESLLYFWLSRARLGAHRVNELLETAPPGALWDDFGRFRDAWGDKYAVLRDSRDTDFLQEELARMRAAGISVMTRANPAFPERLRQREVSPPVALYVKGDVSLLSVPSVAVVGTRACSNYGQTMAQRLASGLAAANVAVVSGLATGIDGYALRAALDAGGKVVTVLPSGLDRITPVSHAALFAEIADKGLAVSELPPGTEAMKFTFPERNRLIAGLSLGTAVVEAPAKSGALLTAGFALEQGREVFAVPGNVTSPRSAGTNALIADGAVLVTSADDILSGLGLRRPAAARKDDMHVSPDECRIIELLEREGAAHFDALCDRLGMKPYELTPILVELELKDLILRLPSNTYGIKDLLR